MNQLNNELTLEKKIYDRALELLEHDLSLWGKVIEYRNDGNVGYPDIGTELIQSKKQVGSIPNLACVFVDMDKRIRQARTPVRVIAYEIYVRHQRKISRIISENIPPEAIKQSEFDYWNYEWLLWRRFMLRDAGYKENAKEQVLEEASQFQEALSGFQHGETYG